MVPTAATPSRSRSAPVVGRVPLTGPVALVTVVVVPGPVPGGFWPPPGVQWLPWQPPGGAQESPWQPVGGVQWSPWQPGGVQWSPWQPGPQSSPRQPGPQSSPWQPGPQSSPVQAGGLTSAPPWQPELAKPPTAAETPHTLTGVLTGALTVLPEPRPTLPMPVTLPLWPGAPPDTLVVAPPWQPELPKPSSASDRLHRLTGALTGAVIVLPDAPETLPMPVTLPL